MSGSYELQHDEADIAADITLNYERLLESRERGEDTLEITFEQRMNTALDRYSDLLKVLGRMTLEAGNV